MLDIPPHNTGHCLNTSPRFKKNLKTASSNANIKISRINSFWLQLVNTMKLSHDKILLREIIIILFVKLVLLFFIWHSFFNDETLPVTANTIADKFISDSALGDSP
jgi:hypothetical protein